MGAAQLVNRKNRSSTDSEQEECEQQHCSLLCSICPVDRCGLDTVVSSEAGGGEGGAVMQEGERGRCSGGGAQLAANQHNQYSNYQRTQLLLLLYLLL